jgi:hypothetical protein
MCRSILLQKAPSQRKSSSLFLKHTALFRCHWGSTILRITLRWHISLRGLRVHLLTNEKYSNHHKYDDETATDGNRDTDLQSLIALLVWVLAGDERIKLRVPDRLTLQRKRRDQYYEFLIKTKTKSKENQTKRR